MGSNDNKILIPLANQQNAFLQTKGIQSFEIKARDPKTIPAIKEQLQQVLTAKIGDPVRV